MKFQRTQIAYLFVTQDTGGKGLPPVSAMVANQKPILPSVVDAGSLEVPEYLCIVRLVSPRCNAFETLNARKLMELRKEILSAPTRNSGVTDIVFRFHPEMDALESLHRKE